ALLRDREQLLQPPSHRPDAIQVDQPLEGEVAVLVEPLPFSGTQGIHRGRPPRCRSATDGPGHSSGSYQDSSPSGQVRDRSAWVRGYRGDEEAGRRTDDVQPGTVIPSPV